MLKMAVREEARRQLCLDRRDIRNILLGHENNGAKAVEDEIQAPPSAEKLSSDFMDEVMAMPEDMRRIVLHCIDNAHRYPHARLSGSAKMGLKRGESNGLLLDACGGSICEARKAMVIIKAWLRGKRGGELIRVSREYSLGLARNKTKNRRKYARLRAEKGGLAE